MVCQHIMLSWSLIIDINVKNIKKRQDSLGKALPYPRKCVFLHLRKPRKRVKYEATKPRKRVKSSTLKARIRVTTSIPRSYET